MDTLNIAVLVITFSIIGVGSYILWKIAKEKATNTNNKPSNSNKERRKQIKANPVVHS